MQLKPIDQQVVVIFGASSGIGRETALRFAARGAKVVVSARSEEGLQSLVEEIKSNGGEAIAVPANATNLEQVRTVAETAVREYGHLDTWVHAAAVAVYATFEQTTPREFKRIIDVNLTGQAYGAMAALPHLKNGGGALIHISSVEARRAFPYHSAYAASKHGVSGFVDVLRMELQHEGVPVSVTNVMPAAINTPFFNKARTKIGVKPMGAPPIYQPGIVADAILYAAEHPTPEIIVGGAGKAFILGQRLAPRLMDALIARVGFTVQRTKEPKSENEPFNLFDPINDYNRVEGDFSNQARGTSVGTWLETHPIANTLVRSTALVAAVLLMRRALKD
jgi:NAD(P)-dependent dehydrogenase (short-subunit alcohol dehydrogenase family)